MESRDERRAKSAFRRGIECVTSHAFLPNKRTIPFLNFSQDYKLMPQQSVYMNHASRVRDAPFQYEHMNLRTITHASTIHVRVYDCQWQACVSTTCFLAPNISDPSMITQIYSDSLCQCVSMILSSLIAQDASLTLLISNSN